MPERAATNSQQIRLSVYYKTAHHKTYLQKNTGRSNHRSGIFLNDKPN